MFIYKDVAVRVVHIVVPMNPRDSWYRATFVTHGIEMIVDAPQIEMARSESRIIIDMIAVEGAPN